MKTYSSPAFHANNDFGKLFIIAMLFISPFCVNAQTKVSFYLQAHEDDWQLFMSQNVMEDVSAPKSKIVFITLTAGDAGINTRGNGFIPYFSAREKGAVFSSKMAVDLSRFNLMPDSIRQGKKVSISYMSGGDIVKHDIMKYQYSIPYSDIEIIDYFLRLPDGYPGGNRDVSLQKLWKGQIETLCSIDSTDCYHGRDDLTKTIRQIILNENPNSDITWINVASLDTNCHNGVQDTNCNKGDHSDHLYTSIFSRAAVHDFLFIGIRQYVDYNKNSFTENVSGNALINTCTIYAMYCWGVSSNGYDMPFDAGYRGWLARCYFNTVREPQ